MIAVVFMLGVVNAIETITLTDYNSTLAIVSVTSADNMYGYELNFDYTGSISSVSFYNFLSSAGDGSDTTAGYTNTSNVLTVYESRLDNTKTGISGNGNLFNITHSGTLTKNSFLGLDNSSQAAPTETTIDYTCGNGVCNGAETCSVCSADCGVCAVTSASPDSGAGGGGGGAVQAKPDKGVEIDTHDINLNLVLNSNKERAIRITNKGNKEKSIFVGQKNLDGMVLIKESSFTLAPGETTEIRVIFLASEKPGIYTGKLIIAGNDVLVSVNVRTKELLFDAMIVVPNEEKIISVGGNLDAQVTLIPMGEEPRVDVTLNYVVKDYDGNTYMTESETILVEGQKTFKKQISTKGLPVGGYVVGLEVVYPGGVAASSSHFEVSQETKYSLTIVIVVAAVGVFVLTAFAILLSRKYKKNRRKYARGKF